VSASTTSDRRGAAPPAPSTRGGARRVLAGTAALLAAVSGSALIAPSASASLAAGGVGPIDPATNFPSYFTDTNGLSLQLCQDGLPNCLAGPEQIQDVHAAGGDAEAFYYAADATTTNFTVHLALEAAYAADGPDQEVVFQRTQLTARDGGLRAGTVYKITDPYGTYNCTVEADGTISQNACRIETTPVERDFNRALNGRLGPFLTQDPTEPAPPPGFIGDNTTPRKVIGSPTGFNAFRVEGPGLAGTCTNADGSTTSSCEQTDRFILQGKIQDTGAPAASVSQGTLDFGDLPGTPAVTKTLTYANTGTVPVTIGSVVLGGTNASAFAMQNNCGTTVEAGARCTIDVTFTPEAGKSSAATLTITDNTAASPRNIALKGSNLPVPYVADPAPPAGLAFGTVGVGSTSLEDNVVIGNSGNGPLTIPATGITITGASGSHYKLGPNNTCRTPVAPDSGCEIGVQFAPTSTGSKTANLRVTDSNGKILNVPLTGTGGAADTLAPTAPTLSAATLSGTTANLTWTAATDNIGVTGYQVLRNGTQVGTNLAGTARTFADANLAPGTYSYTVKAVDAAGNASAASNARSVTVASAAGPTLTTRAPAVNATGVAVGANVTATFNTAVQGVNTATFALRPTATPTATPIAATVTQATGTNRWVLNPTANLVSGTSYTATLTGGATAIRNAAGTPFATTSWSFTTAGTAPAAGGADTTAPTLTARAPAVNATGVTVGANVTATFNEAVQGVGTGTFQLRAPNGTVIGATVTQATGTNRWVLNPNASLARNTLYTVTLTGGATAIRDTAGNAFTTTTTWSFRTVV
jgi:Bacterial Ig-like domain/Abnormal spindle-like microcephaly-assoc'd, ASPM-SPD-2-Hydin